MENMEYSDQRTLLQIQELILRENDFLVTSHVHPDGDSLASILAFTSILKYHGKRYTILLDDDVPRKFDFLAGIDEITRFDCTPLPSPPNVLIFLDSSNIERTGEIQSLVKKKATIIDIDHHPSNERFGTFNLIRDNESSTVEIVYDLISSMRIPITPDIASYIYTGILCDTGRFLFPNTTARSLAICAEMVKKGASPDHIAKKLYLRMSHGTVLALASALSTLEFHFNGVVSCIYLSNGLISKGEEIDTEGFVDYLLAIDETEVEFLMVEKEPNLFRVSFRSKSYVNVNEVAKKFGGGGHMRASGCTLKGSVDLVKNQILDVLKDHLR